MTEFEKLNRMFSRINKICDDHLPINEVEFAEIDRAERDIKESLARTNKRKSIRGKKLG